VSASPRRSSCVAPTYNDVLAIAEVFDIQLKDAQLRPMTLLVANAKPREYDYVNDPLHLSPDDRNAVDLLAIEPRMLAKLDERHRVELRHLVVTACELAHEDADLRRMLLRMLRATVVNSHDELYAALTYLVQFEHAFGQRVIGVLTVMLGEDRWFPRVKEWCEQSDSQTWRTLAEEMAKPMKTKWTLATYRFLAMAAAELDPGVQGRLESELGTDWAKGTQALEALRDDYAHGRIYNFKRLDLYDGKLTDYLVGLMDAAALWRRCDVGSLQPEEV
jgi:hypothetical protein